MKYFLSRAELLKARFHTIPDVYAPPDGDPPFHPVEIEHVTLNGEASLPEGYYWCKLEFTQLNALASHLKREGIRVGRSKNLVKGLASVAQLVYSSITLYRARGSQIQRYGYAAFGLSVFPYTLMSFLNLVVAIIVGEYSTLFVLRTAISDEAKRCGGTISGEIGTLAEVLPEAGQSASVVESPVEEKSSLNEIEVGNDGEDRHNASSLSNDGALELLGKYDVEQEHLLEEATTTPPETRDIGSIGSGLDGSGVPTPEDPAVFLSGEPLVAAYLRVEHDGVLVITMKGRTGRFKLIEGDDAINDDPLTFHFHVSAVTNQENVLEREEPPWTIFTLIFILFFLILIILPYVFIFRLSGFHNGDSTSVQRGWMMSWLVFSQISSFFGFGFSITDRDDMANPMNAASLAVFILVWSIPAIGGFVVVREMLLEFGTCSLSP